MGVESVNFSVRDGDRNPASAAAFGSSDLREFYSSPSCSRCDAVPKEFGAMPTFFDSAQESPAVAFALRLHLASIYIKAAFVLSFLQRMQELIQPNDTRDRSGQEPRQPRDVEKPRQPRDAEQPRQPRDADQPRQPRDAEQPRQPRDAEQPRQPRDAEQPRQPRDDEKATQGRDIYRLDFSGGKDGDKNVTTSIDNNRKNFGGSDIAFKRLPDGKEVANFKIDRWPDLPAGWERNPPDNVSDSELNKLKERRSYRAELTSYTNEDRLEPGKTYQVNFRNQLVKWDRDASEWGDMFFQFKQSRDYGVPELAIGTHKGKYSVFVAGKWHDVPLPPVSETVGEWQDWNLRFKMPKADGTGGQLDFYRNGEKFFSVPNYKLHYGYGEGNPYLKFGVYKAVYNGDDRKSGMNTQGSRHREINFDSFSLTDVSRR